jgi:hypothetical protein
MHSLIHLAEECKVHGTLEDFSAFLFENSLGKLKKRLKGNRLPLAEMKRKIELLDRFQGPPNKYDLSAIYKFTLSNLRPKSRLDVFLEPQTCGGPGHELK